MTEQDDPTSCETFLEYHGVAGATSSCAEAVERLLYNGVPLRLGLILTYEAPTTANHALLLTDVHGDEIAIKSGFTSGYGGSGPKGFSVTLGLLDWHGVELDEVRVDKEVLNRLDASALTILDLHHIRSATRLRPQRLWDYIFDADEPCDTINPWLDREPIVPLTLLDSRLAKAARDFWDDPDGKLMKAHRQLEVLIREKAHVSLDEAAGGPAATYKLAFNGENPRLRWPGISRSEHAGRANIFMGVLQAYRHVRAHRTGREKADEQLCELLLLNHLYRLEADTVQVVDKG